MRPAALPLAVASFGLLTAGPAVAADAPSRAAPSRPASPAAAAMASTTAAPPVPTRRLGGIEYVSTADVASRLALTLTATDRGRKVVLTGPATRAGLERDARDVTINGLRVFLGDPVLESGGQLQVSRTDFERALTPVFRAGQGVAVPVAPRTIVLDPGHGGKDTGTSVNEKAFALDVARRAKKTLAAAGGRGRSRRGFRLSP